MWILEKTMSELPVLEGLFETIRPGDFYPGGYRGSKFTVKSKTFQIKSYGDGPPTSRIPKGLVDAMEKYANKRTGTIRIRSNGDTLTKLGENDIYLGRMVFGNDREIFNGVQLFPEWKQEGFLWPGPQSSNDVGEKWVVPAPNNNRPHLGRGRREQRVWSIKKRFDVTDLILNYKEQGGRLYVTFNGFIVSPIPITRLRHIDFLGQLKSLNAQETTQISARWIKDRLKRVQPGYGAVPYAMFVVGKLDGNVEQSITDIQNVRDDDEIES
jgi:hypothetical protein